jgi:hypothetical protein
VSHRLVDAMESAWTSSNPAVLQAAAEGLAPFVVEGSASNRLTSQPGSLGVGASVTFAVPLDLGAFDELRFWLHASRGASGSQTAPFFLEFSYTDTGDLPGELHRWSVPVTEAGKWEHRRVGIEQDRRTAINQMQFRCLTDLPFVCRIDELLAVREEMLADLESALTLRLGGLTIPGLTTLPLTQAANGGTQMLIAPAPGFEAGNQVLVAGGSLGDEIRDVTAVSHTPLETRLTLAATLDGNFPAGTGTVSLRGPVIVEVAPGSAPSTLMPAIVVTPLDAREDPERTPYVTQRDSFRIRGGLTVCSVRASARAYVVNYQIRIPARSRPQQLFVQTQLLQRLSADLPIRINGVPSPVTIVRAPALDDAGPGVLQPIYLQIGTRMETAPRVEQPWVRQAEARSAPKDSPLDQEGIVIQL